jgi:hypothetical protein
MCFLRQESAAKSVISASVAGSIENVLMLSSDEEESESESESEFNGEATETASASQTKSSNKGHGTPIISKNASHPERSKRNGKLSHVFHSLHSILQANTVFSLWQLGLSGDPLTALFR